MQIGCDSFRSNNFSQYVDLCIHWQHFSQLVIDFLMIDFFSKEILESFRLTALSDF